MNYFAYGFGPKSFTDVSTSKSTFTFLLISGLSAGTTILSSSHSLFFLSRSLCFSFSSFM